ncbi:MAG: hypothetical protein B6U89_01550 [Desulfurococcales archaeon ex4484_58]|nr:MAG: hypothetical protein B6U89_01550 [Desulfurococcales archaeon ex4484_58]
MSKIMTNVERELRRTKPLISFIRSNEIVSFLKKQGIELDQLRCFKCGVKINRENIGAIINDRGKVIAICKACLRNTTIFALYREFMEEEK